MPIIDEIKLSKELIRFPSVTPVDAGAIKFLSKKLKSLGFKCKILEFKDKKSKPIKNLYARLGSKQPNICYAGHTDVVPPGNYKDWTINPFKPIIKKNYLIGRGANDMKSSIACFTAAVSKYLKNNPKINGSISFLITGDEEADSINGVDKVVDWISAQGIRIDGSIATESSSEKILGDQIKVGRKGAVDIHIELIGKQGHAAYPQIAKNPVHGISKIIDFFDQYELDKGTEFYEQSSIQFTQLNLNNKAKNVIPERLKVVADMRFNDLWSKERIENFINENVSRICDANGFTHKTNLIFRGLPFHSFDSPFTKNCVKAIKDVTGIDARQDTGGGTSDARFMQRICPVFEFGTINKTLHKVDECVSIEDLKTTEKIYYKTLENFFS